MTPAETAKILTVLKASYPRQELTSATVSAYSAMLADLPYESVDAAVRRLIASSKWFPTIAEIRSEVAEGKIAELPAAEVAWGEVRKAISKFGYYRVPVFKHEAIARAVDVIGWDTICLDENVAATRKRFIDAYASYRGEERRTAVLGRFAPPHLLDKRRNTELLGPGAARLLREEEE